MRTLANDHDRFQKTYFEHYKGYYFTGDGCRRDKDGYYWLTGTVSGLLLALWNICVATHMLLIGCVGLKAQLSAVWCERHCLNGLELCSPCNTQKPFKHCFSGLISVVMILMWVQGEWMM